MWEFKKFENNTALISEGGRQITYRELDVLQKQYAAFMDSERSFVFLICDISVESILIYISCIQNRIPVMVLDNKLSGEKVADLIYAYQPDYIWDFGKQYFWEEYILEKSFQDFCLYHKTQNRVSVNKDLALVLLTSGSVGSKKGVRISYQNIESNMRSIAKSLELSEKDVAMVMLPMCYTYGLSVIHSNLSVGGTLLVPKSQIFTARFWEFFKIYNGSSICGVPYTYQLLRRLGFYKKELPSLRLITQAGGALGIEEQKYLLEYAKKHDVNVAIMYGQTEATARISCYFLNRHPEKIGSVGKVISGGVIEIESRESETEGEIIYLGDNVSLGYAQSYEDLCKNAENNRTICTGDIGYLDDEGYLYIIGRKKRFAKILGVRMNLDDLQRVLSQKSHAIIFCIEYNEKIYAFVEKESNICKEKVINAIEEIGMDKRIFEIVMEKKIPRECNGKVSYSRLLKDLEGEKNGCTNDFNAAYI